MHRHAPSAVQHDALTLSDWLLSGISLKMRRTGVKFWKLEGYPRSSKASSLPGHPHRKSRSLHASASSTFQSAQVYYSIKAKRLTKLISSQRIESASSPWLSLEVLFPYLLHTEIFTNDAELCSDCPKCRVQGEARLDFRSVYQG